MYTLFLFSQLKEILMMFEETRGDATDTAHIHCDDGMGLDMIGAISTEREEKRKAEAVQKFTTLLATKKRHRTRIIKPIDLHGNTDELILLRRVYHELEAKNPNFHKGKMQRKLPPPNTAYIGSRKTGWNNFAETCKEMNRNVEHVRSFFLTEMNTDGNLNADNNLILKGRWKTQQIQSILTKYIKEYVRCSNCRSPETNMTRDASTRLFILSCNVCHAKRSVEPIKAGFHAKMKGERRALRAAK
ncbi:translation initiation factor if-2 betam beta subunit ZnR [Reticulomyxa filosa]|uniref:Translation initiation factor if-2 betam beta subunit ZnR n=1 Tax=Reticulomyxa filosa TaxID=46433 RepID=X6LQD6_RETFI|nr:translation initiation factor if-2 betam beta subunit ZnR [Reticulomyxa filosa]|eukprot:ETO03611.1 translation initiation factor if-2 betam beta subunit ZnR [Reticulomyxa filosa]